MIAEEVEMDSYEERWRTRGRLPRSNGRRAGESYEGSSSKREPPLEAAELDSERRREGGTVTWCGSGRKTLDEGEVEVGWKSLGRKKRKVIERRLDELEGAYRVRRRTILLSMTFFAA